MYRVSANYMALVPVIILLTIGAVWSTDRPIIGILTEEVNHKTYPDYSSFIAASYVKMVEQSGARVVPIFINRTEQYYRDILNAVNGVLLPGGGLSFTNVGGYADAGRIIFNYTKQVNKEGDHFPILGVCLGYELLFYLEVESYDILGFCNSTNIALPLKFKKFYHSKLYNQVPKCIRYSLSNLPLTYNYHRRCITEDQLKQYNLNKKWHVLTTSTDEDGKDFISSIESRHYPVAGIQFHPEKNAFEWSPTRAIPHSTEAIQSARYFYDWLVGEATRNKHTFNSTDEEKCALIYNYYPTFTDSTYEQMYLFR